MSEKFLQPDEPSPSLFSSKVEDCRISYCSLWLSLAHVARYLFHVQVRSTCFQQPIAFAPVLHYLI